MSDHPEPAPTVLSDLTPAQWLQLRSTVSKGWNYFIRFQAAGKWRALDIFRLDRTFKTKREAATAATAIMDAEGTRRAWRLRRGGIDPVTGRPFAKTPEGRYRISRFDQTTGEILEEFEVPNLMEVFGDDHEGRRAATRVILTDGKARCGGGAGGAFDITELARMPAPEKGAAA